MATLSIYTVVASETLVSVIWMGPAMVREAREISGETGSNGRTRNGKDTTAMLAISER